MLRTVTWRIGLKTPRRFGVVTGSPKTDARISGVVQGLAGGGGFTWTTGDLVWASTLLRMLCRGLLRSQKADSSLTQNRQAPNANERLQIDSELRNRVNFGSNVESKERLDFGSISDQLWVKKFAADFFGGFWDQLSWRR